MTHRNRNRMLGCMAWSVVAALVLGLSACGGSNQAAKLLRETFSPRHRVASGNLALAVTVDPLTASAANGPITLSLGGPFQSLGAGRLPASAFTVSLVAMGKHVAATITSTGSAGYVTYLGQSYKLPQGTFQQLEASFLRLGTLPGAGSGSGSLGRLGINPQRWLVSPQIVGNEAIQGTNTTRIHAQVDMPAFLADLSRFLARAAAAGAAGARNLLPASTRRRIAGEVKNPTVNVWTGVTDKTLRRLELDLTVPVSGQLSGVLGRSAAIGLIMQYTALNQPQAIVAPTKLLPYSQFQAKLQVLLQDLGGGLPSLGSGGGGGASAGGGPAGPNYQPYTQCLQSAAGDISKMQKCASLLPGP